VNLYWSSSLLTSAAYYHVCHHEFIVAFSMIEGLFLAGLCFFVKGWSGHRTLYLFHLSRVCLRRSWGSREETHSEVRYLSSSQHENSRFIRYGKEHRFPPAGLFCKRRHLSLGIDLSNAPPPFFPKWLPAILLG